MKFNLMNVIGGIMAALSLIGAILAADGRYTKTDDLEHAKNEIINEMRREVAKNRAGMIASLQRDADDIEFIMMEHEQAGTKAPRYIIEKHKQIQRQIDDLQDVDKKVKRHDSD